MLGISTDGKQIEFLWFNGKRYKIKITDGVNELDFNDLGDTYKKIIDDREAECKAISQLGGGLTVDTVMSRGFLLGWLVKSIKDNHEKANDCKLNIQVEEEEVSNDEIKEYAVKSLRNMADQIESSDDDKLKKSPIVRADVDGLELF